MTNTFKWYERSSSGSSPILLCRTTGAGWEEIRPALESVWVRFTELLGTTIPLEHRHQIHLDISTDSGRFSLVNSLPELNPAHDLTPFKPREPQWCVDFESEWVESIWYDAGIENDEGNCPLQIQTEIRFGEAILHSAATAMTLENCRRFNLIETVLIGGGLYRSISPAEFRARLGDIVSGKTPELQPYDPN